MTSCRVRGSTDIESSWSAPTSSEPLSCVTACTTARRSFAESAMPGTSGGALPTISAMLGIMSYQALTGWYAYKSISATREGILPRFSPSLPRLGSSYDCDTAQQRKRGGILGGTHRINNVGECLFA